MSTVQRAPVGVPAFTSKVNLIRSAVSFEVLQLWLESTLGSSAGVNEMWTYWLRYQLF